MYFINIMSSEWTTIDNKCKKMCFICSYISSLGNPNKDDEIYSFDFDFGVEEDLFEFLETFEEDLLNSSDSVQAFDF